MEKKHNITICLGSSCFTRGNDINLEVIKKYIARNGMKDQIDFRGHLCANSCSKGPVLNIDGITYYEVQPDQVEQILSAALNHAVEV
ncbi:MAG TPA: electron transport complex protein RnfG [Bacteroidales bacterium]|nr:MAG: hypothetical protein A2X11_04295 [Bacteroidetes bacterium GWE2_42_24]OFY25251.1 MAG: hypothetical protein A2X09_11000 [Bacteroidetes bacterium GWF2_43_11]HAQ65937.1 electron transport complex protein RnfG [Bacteroidales bacterium]HBZ66953.1 electron transport complex protein RnfG [Bacteroidales bacterium]